MKTLQLLPHQIRVLQDTAAFDRVGYFLDMGTGKTFVGGEKLHQLNSAVNVVICQKSKIADWIDHFADYYPQMLVYDLTRKQSSVAFQKKIVMGIGDDEQAVGVINYELAFRRAWLKDIQGMTLLLDESQYIQNETAKRSKFTLGLHPAFVILLSGTPTSGKYERLWSQCQLLGWNISKDAYWNNYIDTVWVEDPASGYKRQNVIGYKNVDRLKRKLHEHGAVFMKLSDIPGMELPDQQDITLRIPMSQEYKRFMKNNYLKLNLKGLREYWDYTHPHETEVKTEVELVGDTILAKLLYARQLCGQYSQAKIAAVDDLIGSTEDRIVIFYNFNAELDILMLLAAKYDRPVSTVNGHSHDLNSYEASDNSLTFVQYQAGAMGLNLQKAHITIYFTLPFGLGSCNLWEQSRKRTHRIGQNSKCFYYYPLVAGSIEEINLNNLKKGVEYNEKLFERDFAKCAAGHPDRPSAGIIRGIDKAVSTRRKPKPKATI